MKWRLFAAFATLMAIILLAQDIPMARYLRDVEYERAITALERDAFVIAGTTEDVLAGQTDDPIEQVKTTVDLYTATHGHAHVVVVNADGRLVASSDDTPPGVPYTENRPALLAALAGEPTPGRRNTDELGGDTVFVAVPVLSGAKVVGAVRITHPWSEVNDAARSKQRVLWIVFGVSMVATLIAVLLMSSSLAQPLRRLQGSTERLAEGDFSVRADERAGPGEIRSLAVSFNSMTEQIEGLVQQQRDFASDASHQLRSPLTALRLRLEQAMADVDDLGQEESSKLRLGLEAAATETERLQRLIEGLLMLARAESLTALVDVDLARVVAERGQTWAPLAEERGVTLVVEPTTPVVVRAASNAVEQIIDNYLDNALAVSPSGSTITLRTEIVDSWGVAHVLDEGPGLPVEHRQRVFDRFWRAPEAAYSGSGIGLAIVKRLALASGGEVALDDRTGQPGADAVVRLPLVVRR